MGSSNVQTALRCLITGSIFRREKRHVISVKADDVYFHGPPNFSEIKVTAPLSQPLLTFVSAMAVTRGKISPMAVTKAICLEFGFYYSHN